MLYFYAAAFQCLLDGYVCQRLMLVMAQLDAPFEGRN